MREKIDRSQFFKSFTIKEEYKKPSSFDLEQFQEEAVVNLSNWFNTKHKPFSGGVLAIPTGGGKTLVATRFLTTYPLSSSYKILWMAHTHHLLDQAFGTFCNEIRNINPKNKKTASLRVVSGSENHYSIRDIEATDDVIFTTLQTITRAYDKKHPNLEKFLNSTDGKLLIVFDEAHHAPANTYRKLILSLREKFPGMYLLGLTATPTRTDVKKGDSKVDKEKSKKIIKHHDGRLKELFPQGNLYKISISKLIALDILAEPRFWPPIRTEYEVKAKDKDIKKIKTSHLIPENIITDIANNGPRNEFIAETYANHKDKFGKTIIFADRRHQCIILQRYLKKKDVNSGFIFSYGKEDGKTYKRSDEENKRVLKDFKDGKLDVLINIRMLTEGTDVPQVKTVFLTRQTMSEILMTQMVGRALRGRRFNGTKYACIVPFIDEWKHKILWVPPEIIEGEIIPGPIGGGSRDGEWVSFDALRKLADEIFQGYKFDSYLKRYIPLGWYQISYSGEVKYKEDFDGSKQEITNSEHVRDLVMVFEDEKNSYENFINKIIKSKKDLNAFRPPKASFKDSYSKLEKWYDKFFPIDSGGLHDDILINLFNITCHIAQNGIEPLFFFIEKREEHDMDQLVERIRKMNIQLNDLDELLLKEYKRTDLYWDSIYPDFSDFYRHFILIFTAIPSKKSMPPLAPLTTPINKEKKYLDELGSNNWKIREKACKGLLELGKNQELEEESIQKLFDIYKNDKNSFVMVSAKETLDRVERQLLNQEKRMIKKRDGYKCLCCGENYKPYLQIDHIKPKFIKIDNSVENLQTLCKTCNRIKGTDEINFRVNEIKLEKSELKFPEISQISNELDIQRNNILDPEWWEKYLRRKINFIYNCDAVKSVKIPDNLDKKSNWTIKLYPGNNPEWIKPFIKKITPYIQYNRSEKNLIGPKKIEIK